MSAIVEERIPLARKASRREALLKVLLWGEAGARKTRTALSFPAPLVLDLERGSELYGDEYDFLVAFPDPKRGPAQLVRDVLQELIDGVYPGVRTLVIDPITDYLDALEAGLMEIQRQRGVDLDRLAGMRKAQAYAEIRDGIRERLDRLLRLPVNVVFVARAKNVWGKGEDNKMQPIDRTYDARDIVEYLVDVVVQLQPGNVARVKKCRGLALPEVVQDFSFATLKDSLLRDVNGKPLAAPARPSQDPSEEERALAREEGRSA